MSHEIANNINIADLTDKVALITGASSGIGRAIGDAYAKSGARIISADLTPNPPSAPLYTAEKAESGIDVTTPTVDFLNEKYVSTDEKPRAIFVQTDVVDSASVKNAVDVAVKTFGRLDVYVNCAGVSSVIHTQAFKDGNECKLHETEDEVFDRDVRINGRGVWNGIKYAVIQMLKQPPHASGDRGWIITISSIMANVAVPGSSSYCGTKAIGPSLTRAAALDYARDKIHINCITPGWIDTAMWEPLKARSEGQAAEQIAQIKQMIPWGRMAQPSDVAQMALFLAGPGAAFCTGGQFTVDGGYTAL